MNLLMHDFNFKEVTLEIIAEPITKFDFNTLKK